MAAKNAAKSDDKLVAVHAKIPRETLAALHDVLKTMRKADPMANLSDAVRATLDRGLKR